MKAFAKEKLVTKQIEWKEAYTEKTEYLKEQFEDVVGPGSYFRFEGKDRKTGDEYYVIIGPAKIHNPKAKFFAGVRKLPATFSAGGKYFDSMDGAASYARETWGVSTPGELKPYTSAALYDISDKIDHWKKRHERKDKAERKREDEKEKDDNEDSGIKNQKEGTKMVSFNLKKYIKENGISNSNLMKEAMGAEWWVSRNLREAEYGWWRYQDLQSGGDDLWHAVVEKEPKTAEILMHDCAKLKKVKDDYIIHNYGVTDPHFFTMYVGYNPLQGGYIVSIGPYISEDPKLRAVDRFYVGTKHKRWATTAQIKSSILKCMKKYAEDFGDDVELNAADFTYVMRKADPTKIHMNPPPKEIHTTIGEFSGDQLEKLEQLTDAEGKPISTKQMEGEGSGIKINPTGIAKILEGCKFFKDLTAQLGQTMEQIIANPRALKALYKVQVDKYKAAVASGSADINNITPPPKWPFSLKANSGQQIPIEVYSLSKVKLTPQQLQGLSDNDKKRFDTMKTEPPDMVGDESMEKLGFRSFKDALLVASFYYTGLKKFLADIPDSQDLTCDDLKALRTATTNNGSDSQAPSEAQPEDLEKELGTLPSDKTQAEEVETDIVDVLPHPSSQPSTEPIAPITEPIGGMLAPTHKPVSKKPVSKPVPKPVPAPVSEVDVSDDLENLFGNTLNSLIRISSELDAEGKLVAAEKIHKIIRKYIGRQ